MQTTSWYVRQGTAESQQRGSRDPARTHTGGSVGAKIGQRPQATLIGRTSREFGQVSILLQLGDRAFNLCRAEMRLHLVNAVDQILSNLTRTREVHDGGS